MRKMKGSDSRPPGKIKYTFQVTNLFIIGGKLIPLFNIAELYSITKVEYLPANGKPRIFVSDRNSAMDAPVDTK